MSYDGGIHIYDDLRRLCNHNTFSVILSLATIPSGRKKWLGFER